MFYIIRLNEEKRNAYYKKEAQEQAVNQYRLFYNKIRRRCIHF